jgi:hypothetical protein
MGNALVMLDYNMKTDIREKVVRMGSGWNSSRLCPIGNFSISSAVA